MKNARCILFLAILWTACERNHEPVISGLTCEPATRSAGTLFTLVANAADEDGDSLSFLWSANGGEFADPLNGKQVRWKSPVAGAGNTFTLKITVSDAEATVSKELQILLGQPELGSVQGQVRYTNFNIPVENTIIALGEFTATTSDDGRFFIPGIPAGDYHMTATRPDFTVFEKDIKITGNDTLGVMPEITSVLHTTKLTGNVTAPDGSPIEGAVAVILNPDGTESKLKAATNSEGFYRLWYIPFGDRTIQVKKTATEDNWYAPLKQVITCSGMEVQAKLVMQMTPLRGQFTDPRDNHVYRFKTISKYTWMTENLAYLPAVSPSSKGSATTPYCYVYDYQGTDSAEAVSTANYRQFGVLYNRPAALTACPPGWHLPDSDTEWYNLIITADMPAGTKLKSNTGWTDYGNGNNALGFSALPAGKVTEAGAFENLGMATYFWTTTTRGQAIVKSLFYNSVDVWSQGVADKMGYSVRCVRDQ